MSSTVEYKAMLIAPNEDGSAHAVSVNLPTAENPGGYHRFIGGRVEPGESHRDTIVREVVEELGAAIRGLTYLGTIENIFTLDGSPGHERVYLYSGRLDPPPPANGASLTESDGTVLPVVWRPIGAKPDSLPLYPTAGEPWVRLACEQAQARAASAPS